MTCFLPSEQRPSDTGAFLSATPARPVFRRWAVLFPGGSKGFFRLRSIVL